MIPLSLTISGFLSYRDPVSLDFTDIELACISGANGAGKSSLLDAITWALFGIARKRDEAIINAQSNTAEVSLVFAYEGNTYRVQRGLSRGKTTQLEFQILQERDSRPGKRGSSTSLNSQISLPGSWKPLTERTLRDTQAHIEGTLRMDYETFTNASFFLQGKADLFTQQRPGDRKRILASILGLEVWEIYRQRAADHRKALEAEMSALEGRLSEIGAELDEEKARKARLKELQSELEGLSKSRQAQGKVLESLRGLAAALAERRKGVEALARSLEGTRQQLTGLRTRDEARRQERQAYLQTIERAPQIEADYKAWQQARADIEYWDEIAARFREHEKRRQAPLDEINAGRARLLHEKQTLEGQQMTVSDQQSALGNLQSTLREAQAALHEANTHLARRAELEKELESARQEQADAKAENPLLREKMAELKGRIDQLSQVEGAECPTCGKPLDEYERQMLMEGLTAQGKEMGDRYRLNQSLLKNADQQVSQLEAEIDVLTRAEAEKLVQAENIARLNARMEAIQQAIKDWESLGAPRLAEVSLNLQQEAFNPEARQRLAEIDAELKAIGYDAAAHDAARRREVDGRSAEASLRGLERAQAALAPLERELADLETQLASVTKEADRQQAEYDEAATSLAQAEAQAPDVEAAERDLFAAQELENRLRMDVGAAHQKVQVLDGLKKRRKELEAQREELARLIGRYKQIERACSKDGVPALLIEQALPEIELRANNLLDRLSGGSMSVRFVTQAAYKDRRREDLRETLDIQISDGAGMRDYEMFSGGEAFRVNFAIRLALSEVLAQRAGARLQTLVIDEGFGSQDALGRQRLIEAINLVRPDFAKILVITHVEELKDVFPTRIEVEKGDRGSVVRVM
jgi:exonuclease SbcC